MITQSIILINIIIFFFMISVGGITVITNPSTNLLINFGASHSQLVFDYGEFWRLLTSNYLHIGFAHLLFNMWCLYSIGLELEESVGSPFYLLTYTLSGIIGSLVSCLYYSNIGQNIVSAGASGAVFGIAGTLLVVSIYFVKKFNKNQFNYDYSSLIFFIGFNIIYGLQVTGIDNGAHLGGLMCGLLMGFVFIIISEFS
ncbi:MAG: hypothetical protein CMG76_02085 [Candidatus Marinimicrobia bacterium]|nr:hypothetical protein [Candidatus Neomarinimicrobiota bacterium]